jgi:hypothetical protein
LIAANRISFDNSYQTFKQRNTCAAPSRSGIVISPS